jgi:hypothetical protein
MNNPLFDSLRGFDGLDLILVMVVGIIFGRAIYDFFKWLLIGRRNIKRRKRCD